MDGWKTGLRVRVLTWESKTTSERLIEKFESLDFKEEREGECERWEWVAAEETLDLYPRSQEKQNEVSMDLKVSKTNSGAGIIYLLNKHDPWSSIGGGTFCINVRLPG